MRLITQVPKRHGGARPRARAARTLLTAAAALAVAIVASCRDATGPRLGLTVTVSSSVGPSYYLDAAGEQRVRCDADLKAHNAGTRRADWLHATFTFYGSGDSTAAMTRETIPAATIGSSWGTDSIGPDATQSAHWHLSASVPFVLKIRFYSQVAGGPLDSSAVSVSCEPSTPPGPAPTITALESRPDTALEPGDTLFFHYGAASPVGLWQSIIHMTGPCDTTLLFPELAQPAVGRSVALAMPARCSLGVPIRVMATSRDVLFQESSQSLTLPALVDRTPPVLDVNMQTPYLAGGPAAGFASYVFSGDAIWLNLTARDNHAVHGIYWEVAPTGFRDSTLTSGTVASRSMGLRAQAGWVGWIEPRFYATDESGNVSDTIASATGAIEVFPTVGPAPIVATVPGDITDVAFDAKRGVIYLLQSNAYKIAVLSQASMTVLRIIALTDYAPAIDLSASGDSIITVLMNSHALGIVDLTQASPTLRTVPLAGLESNYRLLDVRVAATGQALIAAQHQVLGGGTRLYSYALSSGDLRLRLDAPALNYNSPGMLERSADRAMIVVNGGVGAFLRYDAGTDTFGPGQTARVPQVRPSVDATGAHIAVAGDVYTASLQYVLSVRAAVSGAWPATISSDGRTHFHAVAPTNARLGIVRSRASDGAIIDHIATSLSITFLRISPDGATLAVVESNDYGPATIGLVNLRQLP